MKHYTKPIIIFVAMVIFLMGFCTKPSLALELQLLSEVNVQNSERGGFIYDMELYDEKLFMASKRLDPVYDVSNPLRPERIFEIPHDDLDESYSKGIKIIEDLYYMYGFCSLYGQFVRIYDISSAAPQLIGENLGGWSFQPARDMDVQDGKIYVVHFNYSGSHNSATMHILDATDPTNIEYIGNKTWSGYGEGSEDEPTSIVVNGNCATVGTEGIRIFNIANPSNINELSKVDSTSAPCQQDDIQQINNIIYKATANLGILVSDAGNPSHSRLVNVIGDPLIALGNQNIAFEVVGQRLYVATANDHQLKVIDISDIKHPQLITLIDFPVIGPTMYTEIEVDEERNLVFLGTYTWASWPPWSPAYGMLFTYQIRE